MKKMILSAAFVVAALGANAQSGSWYIGGSLGFGSSKDKVDISGTVLDGASRTNWNFSPEIGTFLSDNVQLGVAFNLAGSKLEYNNIRKEIRSTTQTGATLYARYFFGDGNFRPFLGANVSVLPGSSDHTIASVTTSTKTMDMGANLNAGFAYAISSRVAVVGSVAALGFNNSTATLGNTKSTTTDYGFNVNTLNNPFNIGVYYTFKK